MSSSTTQNRIMRPPIVVVMGHIDHGKSTLLDYIRKTNIVAGEAGGITQHVGAYEVEHTATDGKKHNITFLDTPGHEAFCSIRERGARAADVAILVVSAEDGVKPQTIEALKAILSEKIPYIVAINKIDKPNSDIDRTKQSLGEHEIYVEGWGGDIPCVPISAVAGTGVSDLLDMIILVSEIANPDADPTLSATGLVVESELDNRKGISATLLIKDGTLRIGDFVVAGTTFTPVRFIENFKGIKIDSGTPSMPVCILGWNEIPVCGTTFVTVESKKIAEKMIEVNKTQKQEARSMESGVRSTKGVETGDEKSVLVTIPLIIKADVTGSLDGVKHELAKIKNEKVILKIVSEGIGDINENDVKTALSDPNITIIGFNVSPDKKSATLLERSTVNWKSFNIIYELTNFIKETLTAKIPKEYLEESTGRAKILAVFSHEKDRQVIGGKVESGIIATGNEVRIMRRETEIGRGRIRELQEKKLRKQEVAEGHEFGVMVEAKTEIAAGDRLEAVIMIEKKN